MCTAHTTQQVKQCSLCTQCAKKHKSNRLSAKKWKIHKVRRVCKITTSLRYFVSDRRYAYSKQTCFRCLAGWRFLFSNRVLTPELSTCSSLQLASMTVSLTSDRLVKSKSKSWRCLSTSSSWNRFVSAQTLDLLITCMTNAICYIGIHRSQQCSCLTTLTYTATNVKTTLLGKVKIKKRKLGIW